MACVYQKLGEELGDHFGIPKGPLIYFGNHISPTVHEIWLQLTKSLLFFNFDFYGKSINELFFVK